MSAEPWCRGSTYECNRDSGDTARPSTGGTSTQWEAATAAGAARTQQCQLPPANGEPGRKTKKPAPGTHSTGVVMGMLYAPMTINTTVRYLW